MIGEVAPKYPALGSSTEMPTGLDGRFGEIIASLRKAQQAVQEELEPIKEVQAPAASRTALLRVHRSVDGLVTQTDALLSQMRDCGASDNLTEAAEPLSDYFCDTRKRIATML